MEDNDVHLRHVEHAKRDRGTEVHGDGQGGRLNVHLEKREAVTRLSGKWEIAAEECGVQEIQTFTSSSIGALIWRTDGCGAFDGLTSVANYRIRLTPEKRLNLIITIG